MRDSWSTNSPFIVFEGLTCSGKSTQSKLLAERFTKEGYASRWNAEPTGGFFGTLIRTIIDETLAVYSVEGLRRIYDSFPELREKKSVSGIEYIIHKIERGKPLYELERQILFICDRLDNIVHTVRPLRDSRTIVVQDRYELSTFTHGVSGGVSYATLRTAQESILGDLHIVPDILVYISVSPETALARLGRRGGISIYDELSQFVRINDLYRDMLGLGSGVPSSNEYARKLLVVDGESSKEEIGDEIWRRVLMSL